MQLISSRHDLARFKRGKDKRKRKKKRKPPVLLNHTQKGMIYAPLATAGTLAGLGAYWGFKNPLVKGPGVVWDSAKKKLTFGYDAVLRPAFTGNAWQRMSSGALDGLLLAGGTAYLPISMVSGGLGGAAIWRARTGKKKGYVLPEDVPFYKR